MPTSNTNEIAEVEDWRWLTGERGQAMLLELNPPDGQFKWIKQLGKREVSPARIKLLVEQMLLRPRAATKFANASQMFFLRRLLEQATDERIARFKASRFQAAKSIFDFCCGLGGDLMSLSTVAPATGIDVSGVAIELARANCHASLSKADSTDGIATPDFPLEFAQCKAEEAAIDRSAWFHIDPDRRIDGIRSTSVKRFSPGIEFLDELIDSNANGAIKLAPATRIPEHWTNCEQQWIGDRKECKQQVAWFGATTSNPGKKTAAAIDHDGSVLFQWTETGPSRCRVVTRVDEFVYEPHATIIAGRMVDSLAAETQLQRLASDIQYLGGKETSHPALTRFRVLSRIRLARRPVEEALKAHDCGQLEIKKRGVDHQLIKKFSNLKLNGTLSLVLILTRVNEKHVALICQRGLE